MAIIVANGFPLGGALAVSGWASQPEVIFKTNIVSIDDTATLIVDTEDTENLIVSVGEC